MMLARRHTFATAIVGAIIAISISWSPGIAADKQLEKRLRVMKKCENCDLSGADLSGINLSRANLNGANLQGANLEGANLTRTTFRGANLNNANLKKTLLRDADLRGAKLNGTDFGGARLSRTKLEKSWLEGANFAGSRIDSASFTHSNLNRAIFRNTDLSKARLTKVSLEGADLRGANLERKNFMDMNFSGADFSGANLKRVNFSRSILVGANFSNSLLQDAIFVDARAQKANFNNADLTKARLHRVMLNNASLAGANCQKAVLKGASLVEANLANADLTEANLSDANLTKAVLTGARFVATNLKRSMLVSANFSEADLSEARMAGANLGVANLQKARLANTDLSRSDLRFANLSGADLDGTLLIGADLRGAKVVAESLKDAKIDRAKFGRDLLAALEKPEQPAARTPSAATSAKSRDPLPDPIVPSGLAVDIVDVVRIPPSSDTRPRARINWLYHAGDGSGRLFVAEMRGKIFVLKDGRVLPTPFLDLAAARHETFMASESSNETGLSSFAFHPNFARRGEPGYGKLYTVHSERQNQSNSIPLPRVFNSPIEEVRHVQVLSEWSVDSTNPDRVIPGTQREVLRIRQPHHWHNIGTIAFNPNSRPGSADYGLMYIAVGDGGDTTYSGKLDLHRVTQDPANPFATILRINPMADGRFPYSVPKNNPFIAKPGHLPEIWAYGLRNPQRFTWDSSGTGAMIIADMGQANIEEINLGIAGANYGWREREGTFVVNPDDQYDFSPLPADDHKYRYVYPVAQYDHSEGFAISGGFVYRGTGIPELHGMYVFGDIVNGRIFHVPVTELKLGRQAKISELTLLHNGQPTTLLDLMGGEQRADLRFGRDEAGEIYVLTKRDGMVRILKRATTATTTRQ